MSHSELISLATSLNINTQNKLGGNLPHVTLQNDIFLAMTTSLDSQIKKINAEVKPVPVIKRNYYVLFVHYGKEKQCVESIVAALKINAIPEYKRNVDNGVIDENFYLDSLIHDIGYPQHFDIHANHIVENYKSYLFVEIGDIYDMRILHNIIEPFFKSIPCVVSLVGLKIQAKSQIKTKVIDVNGKVKYKSETIVSRKKQIYSKQGREVVHWYDETITMPVNVTTMEASRLKQGNFSIYQKYEFNVGDTVWLNTKGNKCKVMITKILDNNNYQVMGKDRFKYPVSGDMLTSS